MFPSLQTPIGFVSVFIVWSIGTVRSFGIAAPRHGPASSLRVLRPGVPSLPSVRQREGRNISIQGTSQRPRASRAPATGATRTFSSATQLDCICVHCKYVTACSAYHFVESRHNQPHMTETPTFTPRDGSPTIHVNVRLLSRDEQPPPPPPPEATTTTSATIDDGLTAPMAAAATSSASAPAVTYEYDVVACQDFVEEKDCWVKNMPEEIRVANPHFVPT